MKKIFRSVAMAGLLATGMVSGSVFAQLSVAQAQPVEIPPLADLVATVTAACSPGGTVASQSQACIDAIVLLLAYYPDSAEAQTVAISFVGAEGVTALASLVEAQAELLGLQTAAVTPPAPVAVGEGGGAPVGPS